MEWVREKNLDETNCRPKKVVFFAARGFVDCYRPIEPSRISKRDDVDESECRKGRMTRQAAKVARHNLYLVLVWSQSSVSPRPFLLVPMYHPPLPSRNGRLFLCITNSYRVVDVRISTKLDFGPILDRKFAGKTTDSR